jgi:hypothetical protein
MARVPLVVLWFSGFLTAALAQVVESRWFEVPETKSGIGVLFSGQPADVLIIDADGRPIDTVDANSQAVLKRYLLDPGSYSIQYGSGSVTVQAEPGKATLLDLRTFREPKLLEETAAATAAAGVSIPAGVALDIDPAGDTLRLVFQPPGVRPAPPGPNLPSDDLDAGQ